MVKSYIGLGVHLVWSMLKSHLNLFHALKLSINFYNMNEVLYLKSVKIIAKIKLNGKENKCKM